jgi:hypothetical protein
MHAIPEPWTGQAAPVLTETDPLTGRQFAVGRLDNGLFVLDDVTAGTRLGSVELVSRFAVEVEGQTGIVLAGLDEHAVTVTVEWDEGVDRRSVHGGAWMTLPRLLTPGEHVTVSWDHQDGEQRFTTLGPLYADDLIPHRPAWTPYASG